MAETYIPMLVPQEYDVAFLTQELQRISNSLQELENPQLLLVPQAVEPSRRKEGMIIYADGTNWNPGAGAGLYEYRGGAWNKL